MIKLNDSKMKFESTGKEIHINYGIIGINEEFSTFEGYDGDLFNLKYHNDPDYEEDLTKEELLELSDYVINLWTIFREKVQTLD
jgi:hypothetical protein